MADKVMRHVPTKGSEGHWMLSENVELNSLGEIVLPVHLNGISEVRAELGENPQLFLDAFEHIAGRDGLILRVLDHYLRALPPEHVEKLIPVLRALGERRGTKTPDVELTSKPYFLCCPFCAQRPQVTTIEDQVTVACVSKVCAVQPRTAGRNGTDVAHNWNRRLLWTAD